MNTSFVRRIQQARLTHGQLKIADYFLKHQNRICTMSSLAVAREVGVSDASIIRFSRAIGYKGFADLKNDLHSNLTQELSQINLGKYPPDKRLDVQVKKYEYLNRPAELLHLLLNNVEQSLRQNDFQQYERAVNLLSSARRHLVLGLHGCQGIALYFARALSFLMDDVRTITAGSSDDAALLQNLCQNDVALAISFARYYKSDFILANLIKSQGISLITLTDSTASPLAQVADVVILVETKHMSFLNSAAGSISVLEYLLAMLCWREPQKYQMHMEEREKFTAPFL